MFELPLALSKLRSCQAESSCYYLVLRPPDPVGEAAAGLTFLCSQCDIAPSSSRLHRISSRATVRRNAGELFLLVRYACARRRHKNSYRPFEGVSCSVVLCSRAGQTDKRRKNHS